jgi:hypothetical protein
MNMWGQFWCAEDADWKSAPATPACNYPPPKYVRPVADYASRCIRPNDSTNLTPVGGSTTYDSWFYDGLLVYQQIAAYQNNPAKWDVCEQNVNQVYRDGFVLPNKGRLAGYMIFTEGLYYDYVSHRTAADLAAIDDIYQRASFAQTFHGDLFGAQREAAYRLEADLWESLTHNQTHAASGLGPTNWTAAQWVQYDVAHILSTIEMYTAENQPFEYFMTGLQAKALINYYVMTGKTDVRIPPAVKQLADYVYSSGYGKQVSDPYAFGYASPWPIYGAPSTGGEALNLLIAPMYAWLFSITGNTTYQTEGDKIWQGGVLMRKSGGANGPFSFTGNGGKVFSQNYEWSFNYVTWRSKPTITSSTTKCTFSPESRIGVNGSQLSRRTRDRDCWFSGDAKGK